MKIESIWPILLLVFALLFAAGCGDDDDDDNNNDSDDDDATDDDTTDDDTSDDDDDSADDDVSWEEADCFDDSGIKVDICQYYGTDFVGMYAYAPAQEFMNDIFPDGFTYVEHDDWDDVLAGTDLGMNVKIGDKTFYFFGDTHPLPEGQGASGPVVGVPWGWDTDGDYILDEIVGYAPDTVHYESVTEHVAFDGEGNPTGLLNDIERAQMFPGGESSGVEVPFFVPTGHLNVDDQTVYYWYGKYVNNTDCDQSHLLAMNVADQTWRYVSPFAEAKFIQISPVLVERDDYPTQAQCPLPWSEDHERGALIFASGRDVANSVSFDEADPTTGGYCSQGSDPSYRKSGLYLGYVKLADLEDELVPSKMYYFTGVNNGCWQQAAPQNAVSIIDKQEFGEFSVRRVPDTNYLVLTHSYQDADSQAYLEQHPEYQGHFIGVLALHAADLAAPWTWTTAKETISYGYGNYLIEEGVELLPTISVDGEVVDDNVLTFIRVISTWKGLNADPNFKEYGTSLIWALTDFDDFTDELAQK
ncbi:MAG TPA: DUF4185 domain-containing protein [bacterium]|nr:DUF4185 domain-containing protein [bacterium]